VQVKEAANGQFEVVAGGRRLAALKLLAKHKEIEADHPVPCNVLNGEDVTEISLAENEIRQAMHPADQFDAFKALADGGMSEDDIAARFGVPPLVVRQRLKLANVSAKIIAAYRKGELDLECVMAFAVTDDHKAQERVWKEWRTYPEYQREAEHIRAMLTEQHIDADSKLALFVTVKAYEKAGGSVIRAPPSLCANPIEHLPVVVEKHSGIGKRPPVFLSNRAGVSMRLAFKQIDEAAVKDGIRIATEIDGNKIQHPAGQRAALDPPDAQARPQPIAHMHENDFVAAAALARREAAAFIVVGIGFGVSVDAFTPHRHAGHRLHP
jgi:hypothetical protein